MFGLTPFRRDMNLLNSFLNDDFLASSNDTFKVDIRDINDQYLIEAELPGVSKEDITLKVENNTLTIKVNTKKERKIDEGVYIKQERKEKEYIRSFKFSAIDEHHISAKYENGILIIHLPKLVQKNNSKNIAIE